jgi:hypothetical protein
MEEQHWSHNCKRCGCSVSKWLFDFEPNLYEILGAHHEDGFYRLDGYFVSCGVWAEWCHECHKRHLTLWFGLMPEKRAPKKWLRQVMEPVLGIEDAEHHFLRTGAEIDQWMVAKFRAGSGYTWRHIIQFEPVSDEWDQISDLVREAFAMAQKWEKGKRVMDARHDARKTRKAILRVASRFGWAIPA